MCLFIFLYIHNFFIFLPFFLKRARLLIFKKINSFSINFFFFYILVKRFSLVFLLTFQLDFLYLSLCVTLMYSFLFPLASFSHSLLILKLLHIHMYLLFFISLFFFMFLYSLWIFNAKKNWKLSFVSMEILFSMLNSNV